jgi:hypothetical protein
VAVCSGTNGASISHMNAGTCTIYANQVGNNDCNTAPQVSQTITVNKKPITVTADENQYKVYGEADPTFTYTTNVALVSGDAFSGALSRAAITNVGKYPLVQNTLALSSNYSLTYVSKDFTITAKPIRVIVEKGQTNVYGKTDPTSFKFTTDLPLVSGDNFTGNLSRVEGEDAGLYAIEQNTLALSTNYNLSYFGDDFEITKATPELSWTNPEDIYSGTALTGAQLNAAANIQGTYSYDPDFGTILSIGNNQELTVKFNPVDNLNYTIVNKSVFTNVLNINSISKMESMNLLIYPNPTNGIIQIRNELSSDANLIITDITGKLIIKSQLSKLNNQIDLSNIVNGLYLLIIQTENQTYTTKIIKE